MGAELSAVSRALWVATAMAVQPLAADAQWLEPPGQGWVDLTVYHQDTRSFYRSDGTERSDGHAVSTSAFLTVVGGLVTGLDAWLQVPYQRLEFNDVTNDRLRTGVGDTRVYLRGAPLRFLGSDFPLAVRAGVKTPVGDFVVDSEVIPLGDGQRDWEVMVELGHSFHPFPGYLSGWVGYRWREENESTRWHFGDEAFALVKGGVSSGRWSVSATAEAIETVTDTAVGGLVVPSANRRIVTFAPSVGVEAGPGTVTLGARFSLAGRNLPAGTAFMAGYFVRWGL